MCETGICYVNVRLFGRDLREIAIGVLDKLGTVALGKYLATLSLSYQHGSVDLRFVGTNMVSSDREGCEKRFKLEFDGTPGVEIVAVSSESL